MNRLQKYKQKCLQYEKKFGMNGAGAMNGAEAMRGASLPSINEHIPEIEKQINNMKGKKQEEFGKTFEEIDAIRENYYKKRLNKLHQERNIANEIVNHWRLRSEQIGIQLEYANKFIKDNARLELQKLFDDEWQQELLSFLTNEFYNRRITQEELDRLWNAHNMIGKAFPTQ